MSSIDIGHSHKSFDFILTTRMRIIQLKNCVTKMTSRKRDLFEHRESRESKTYVYICVWFFFFSRSWNMFGDEVLHFNPIQ